MRGKADRLSQIARADGITPAHAGKSGLFQSVAQRLRDHPRACGEKRIANGEMVGFWGSPPRMRGKVPRTAFMTSCGGITPAHAGKSSRRFAALGGLRDHPRACGEKAPLRRKKDLILGSPPRMRGKGEDLTEYQRKLGITPAHAGKRKFRKSHTTQNWDHPRACGEKHTRRTVDAGTPGSPPRMRGKADPQQLYKADLGITPAHAGKSLCGELKR